MQERLVQKKASKNKAQNESQTRIMESSITYDISNFSTAEMIVVCETGEASTYIAPASEEDWVGSVVDGKRVLKPYKPKAKRSIHPSHPSNPTTTQSPNKTKKNPKK